MSAVRKNGLAVKKPSTKARKAVQPSTNTVATHPNTRNLQPHEMVLMASAQSAAAMHAWSDTFGNVDLSELVRDLRERTTGVCDGNMRSVEAMLFGQATALQMIFTNLSRRAVKQEYLKHFQTYLTLAFKAQSQCRSTLEALAEIKNPRPVAFVRQANIANGPQQVNNGSAPTSENSTRAGAQETQSEPNKLLEEQHGTRLVAGAQSAASGANKSMAAVVKIDGSEEQGR